MQIVITGASKGIGKSIAEIFAKDSTHTLYVCARNSIPLIELKKELTDRFPLTAIEIKVCDVSKKKDIESFAEWVLSFQKPIDILVNNAGLFIPGSIYNEEEGVLEKMLNTNLMSAYYLTRKLISNFIKQKKGIIFNICSIASITAYSNGGSYSISKYALAGFSKNLREEMKPFGVKVCGIYPGATYTDSWAKTDVNPKRLMDADDVAKMVYAASFLSKNAIVEDIILRPQLGDV